ncbi:unnamed protein product [Spirodela intermedia]|uniref:Uncharacterized protein n=1 Tax=Spirodela intermedia TaxID=51605 RepID=A0A7I8JNF8_SPIIN|nr:unnamed protein product [Spirodela intermedia]CAA6671717.1 unnamed protein product [Spirodela intermedia]
MYLCFSVLCYFSWPCCSIFVEDCSCE